MKAPLLGFYFRSVDIGIYYMSFYHYLILQIEITEEGGVPRGTVSGGVLDDALLDEAGRGRRL